MSTRKKRGPHSAETIAKMRQAHIGKRTSTHGFHVGARLYSTKKNARARNIEWLLTDEEAKDIIASDCRYCGAPSHPTEPVLRKGQSWTLTGVNGIDRVDNSKGYLTSNCVACCSVCNTAKARLTVEDFVAWIERVRTHLSSNPL